MAIQAESFIALENSLTLRLQRSLNAATAELYPAIQGMILKQEWAAAESAMRELQLAPLVALNRDYITYLSRLSALFGASRINTTPANSLIGLGIQEPELASNVDSFQRGMVENVQAGMIDSGLAFINAARGDSLIQKADNVVREFAPFMDEEGKAKFNMAASLHTSRLASFGFTAEARFLGITEYQITEQLDGRTCPVCRIMHGKKFKVADARRFLSGLIREKDPEQIKELQPWPSQSKDEVEAMAGMSTAELVANGWHVPPFHPRCRGLLVKVGKAPSLDFPITVPVKEPYEATNDDFLHLGFDLSPTKVKTWNQLMRTSPMEILSKLLGLTQEEVFNKIQGKADPAKALGLRTLAVTQTGVNIELLEEAYGSGSKIAQDLYFRKNKTLYLGLVEMSAGDADKFGIVLRSLYATAKETEMTGMTVVTSSDIGGYAMARYGFTPNAGQWLQIKKQIEALELSGETVGASAEASKALAAALASDDPASLFSIADLPGLGKKLLSKVAWEGTLPFASSEAMTRFATATGGAE